MTPRQSRLSKLSCRTVQHECITSSAGLRKSSRGSTTGSTNDCGETRQSAPHLICFRVQPLPSLCRQRVGKLRLTWLLLMKGASAIARGICPVTADGCQTGLQEHFASLAANCVRSSWRVKGSDLKRTRTWQLRSKLRDRGR